MRFGTDSLLQRATFGFQEDFRGALTAKTGGAQPTDAELDAVGVLAGKSIVNGSGQAQKFYYRGYCAGAAQVRALLQFTAITGTAPTARIFKTQQDHITEFPDDTGASEATAFGAFAVGTILGATLATEGQTCFLLELTVPTGTSVTVGVAEYVAQ